MKFKDKVLTKILDRISDVNKKMRAIEDDSAKFSVDHSTNGVYIALVGSREALQDILSEIRSLNEDRRSNRDI